MKNLASIILAAGSSSRLGQAKQNLHYNNNTFLTNTVEVAQSITDIPPLVVLGFEAQKFTASVKPPAQYCINTHWQSGMASSIKSGLKNIAPDADAVLVLTIDQWKLTSNDLMKLKTAWRQNPTNNIAAYYANTIGIPAIFTRSFFKILLQLEGEGAKHKLIASQPSLVELPNASEDLDTPRDLQNFLTRQTQ